MLSTVLGQFLIPDEQVGVRLPLWVCGLALLKHICDLCQLLSTFVNISHAVSLHPLPLSVLCVVQISTSVRACLVPARPEPARTWTGPSAASAPLVMRCRTTSV